MTALTQKIQVLLTNEQYRRLQALATAHGKPISVLLRESIVEQLVAEARQAAKQKAFEEIIAMTLPVSDWPAMEGEIERSHIENQIAIIPKIDGITRIDPRQAVHLDEMPK